MNEGTKKRLGTCPHVHPETHRCEWWLAMTACPGCGRRIPQRPEQPQLMELHLGERSLRYGFRLGRGFEVLTRSHRDDD